MSKRCVVIGGGIAGASISQYLAARGVGVTLYEKSPQLCSGATWHAAGLVTRFAGSPKLKKLHARSLLLLTDLHDKFDVRLNTPGSIRIVEKGDNDRFKEAKQHVQLGRLYDVPGFPTRLIDPEEIAEKHPLINKDLLECGVWTPSDGDVDPTLLTNCVSSLAKQDGAQFFVRHEVTKVDHLPGNRFRITVVNHAEGSEQQVEADMLINAAGLWSKHVTKLVDHDAVMSHPAFIIEHQYAITEEIPIVKELQQKRGVRLPVLRDLAGSSYIRQERSGMLIGPYESDCQVRNFADERGAWTDCPPADWGMELFPDKLDRIEDNIMHAIELIPVLGEAGIINCTNGPTIWTGDSLARCGRTRIPNYYDFNTLTYGIAQSLPLAEYLGHIILEGEQPWDAASDFDPLRYGKWANDEYTFAKIRDTYSKNNSVSYGSFENRAAGREFVAKHPLYEPLKQRGAVFAFSNGVESPAFFGDANINQAKFDHHEWHATVQKETRAVLDNVGISYASFSKLRVRGKGSRAFLNRATTNLVSKLDGKCRLTYAITPRGKIVAEFTITKEPSDNGEEVFYVVGSRDYADHDQEWLRKQLRDWGHKECGEDIVVENVSDAIDILHIAGPNSRQLLTRIFPDVAAVDVMAMNQLDLLGHQVSVFRVSFTGCQGFELHFERACGPALYEHIVSHPASQEMNLAHFGGYALNSLRIEKGFKIKADLDYAHYSEAGIEPFISGKKATKFLGFDPDYHPTKRATMFRVHTAAGYEWSVPGDTPVKIKGTNEVVGYTTTSAFGAITQQTIAMGFLFSDAAAMLNNAALEVECYGKPWDVTVLDAPPCPVTARD